LLIVGRAGVREAAARRYIYGVLTAIARAIAEGAQSLSRFEELLSLKLAALQLKLKLPRAQVLLIADAEERVQLPTLKRRQRRFYRVVVFAGSHCRSSRCCCSCCCVAGKQEDYERQSSVEAVNTIRNCS
jgi:hypothetical protein